MEVLAFQHSVVLFDGDAVLVLEMIAPLAFFPRLGPLDHPVCVSAAHVSTSLPRMSRAYTFARWVF